MKDLKAKCKELAAQIKDEKIRVKEYQKAHNGWHPTSSLWTLKVDYRHQHIAYSELRGRTRDQIERNPRNEQPWHWRFSEEKITSIKEETMSRISAERAEEAAA